MTVCEAITARRSIRRFQDRPVDIDTLIRLVDLARLCATGGNLQPLRYMVVHEKTARDQVFEKLHWAMYLPGFRISKTERPAGYIVLLSKADQAGRCQYEIGAASTTIALAAVEFGLSTCILAAFDRQSIAQALELPDCYHPELVIAIGYASQSSHVVPFAGSFQYAECSNGDMVVPKLSLEDVLINVKG